MTSFASARPGLFARFALAFVALVGIASCGSGAVSGPSTPINNGPLTISPSEATLYSELPFTFLVTGGTGTYVVTSNDQLTLPVAATVTGGVFTVIPGPVAADTTVTLSVRDTGTATPVTTTLTVKPRTVSNRVTITPSASQSAACGSAVCSGGDAEVRVVLSQGGLPLRNREVRFDVVSGEFRIITSGPGQSEALSLSGTTFTDESGTARMRIRVLADALSQTALLQITDVSSGFTQRTSFTIAPSSNAPLNAQPGEITFIGSATNVCANNLSADVIVFGGRPPYSISNPGTFQISPTVLTQSGERFTVTATGQCTPTDGSTIAVVDGNGATVAISATNRPGTSAAVPPLVVSPEEVTLEACNTVANVIIAGGLGSGTYFARSGNDAVIVAISGSTGSIRRRTSPPSGPVTGPITVAFSDGRSIADVTVNLSGAGAGTCP